MTSSLRVLMSQTEAWLAIPLVPSCLHLNGEANEMSREESRDCGK